VEGDVGCGSRVYPLAKPAVLVMPYYLPAPILPDVRGKGGRLRGHVGLHRVPIGALLVHLLDVTQPAQV